MINIKPFLPSIALVLATSASLAWAAPGDRRPDLRNATDGQVASQGQHNPRRRIARAFRHLDADGNGIITLDEFLAKPLRKAPHQFDRIDTDDDELISLEEFLAIHSGENNDRPEIDIDELRACIAEESGEDVPERPDRSERFALLDTNADGFVDVDEFVAGKTAAVTAKFNVVDADADGGITPAEFAQAIKAKRDRRTVRRDCVRDQLEVDELLEG